MKKIKDMNEWVEAAKADRLMHYGVKSTFSGNLGKVESLEGLLKSIEEGCYSSLPKTVELVEWQKNAETLIEKSEFKWIPNGLYSPGPWFVTGRTATATIQESEDE